MWIVVAWRDSYNVGSGAVRTDVHACTWLQSGNSSSIEKALAHLRESDWEASAVFVEPSSLNDARDRMMVLEEGRPVVIDCRTDKGERA